MRKLKRSWIGRHPRWPRNESPRSQSPRSQESGVRIWRLGVLLTSGFCLLTPLPAQKLDPVQWTLSSDAGKAPSGSTVPLHLTAKLDEGWHLYSLTTPKGGPIPTTAGLADNPAVESLKLFQPKPVRKLDPNFNLDTETFQKEAV